MAYNRCFQFPREKTIECNVALGTDRGTERDQLFENGQDYRNADGTR